jgi:hypothetical protein
MTGFDGNGGHMSSRSPPRSGLLSLIALAPFSAVTLGGCAPEDDSANPDLSTLTLGAGNHAFKVTVTGKNARSTDFWTALDYFKRARRE